VLLRETPHSLSVSLTPKTQLTTPTLQLNPTPKPKTHAPPCQYQHQQSSTAHPLTAQAAALARPLAPNGPLPPNPAAQTGRQQQRTPSAGVKCVGRHTRGAGRALHWKRRRPGEWGRPLRMGGSSSSSSAWGQQWGSSMHGPKQREEGCSSCIPSSSSPCSSSPPCSSTPCSSPPCSSRGGPCSRACRWRGAVP